jgi:hypothetical protein
MALEFLTGQVWKYDHRTGEEGSTIVILKIDQHEKAGEIVHICVKGIKLSNPNARSGYTETIGHMPYSKEALSGSVTSLVSENSALPDFMEGYLQWKNAFDAGKAGWWTIGVKDAIEGMDQVMKGNQG